MARALSLHERYSLARGNVDCAPILAFHAHLDSPYTPEALSNAVTSLLALHPILRCSVSGPRTSHPTLQIQEYKAEKIIQRHEKDSTPEDLLLWILQDTNNVDVEKTPLWRVTTFSPTSVGLGLHHILSDGSGTRTLFAQLLQLLRSEYSSSGPNKVLPPSIDATLDMRPPWSHFLRVIGEELVWPRLPWFMRPTPSPPIFPNPTSVRPLLCPPRLLLLTLPPDLIPLLKASGKSHGVSTIHPILHTAAICALRLVVTAEPGPIHMSTETPRSERSSALGHPLATGNYVSCVSHDQAVTSEMQFWSTCRSYASLLADPHQRSIGRGEMGMLAYISKDVATPDSKGRPRTGWEVFLEKQLESPNSFRRSLEVSNLGLMEETEPARVCWAQMPSPVGAAIAVNVLSTRDGTMSMSIGWRDGAVKEDLVHAFRDALGSALHILGKEESGEDMTFSSLGARVKSWGIQ